MVERLGPPRLSGRFTMLFMGKSVFIPIYRYRYFHMYDSKSSKCNTVETQFNHRPLESKIATCAYFCDHDHDHDLNINPY